MPGNIDPTNYDKGIQGKFLFTCFLSSQLGSSPRTGSCLRLLGFLESKFSLQTFEEFFTIK